MNFRNKSTTKNARTENGNLQFGDFWTGAIDNCHLRELMIR